MRDYKKSQNHNNNNPLVTMLSPAQYQWVAILLISLSLTVCSKQDVVNVHWRGNDYKEVLSIQSLPGKIQKKIGFGRPGLKGIADRNGTFNATDVIDSSFPMRRFAVAGISNQYAIVAVARGGKRYRVKVQLIPLVSNKAKKNESWVLYKEPASLRALIDELDKQG